MGCICCCPERVEFEELNVLTNGRNIYENCYCVWCCIRRCTIVFGSCFNHQHGAIREILLQNEGNLSGSRDENGDSDWDDDNMCPTCMYRYDRENPKIVTECRHHFHLACIYEWAERSKLCPVCNQEMLFTETL